MFVNQNHSNVLGDWVESWLSIVSSQIKSHFSSNLHAVYITYVHVHLHVFYCQVHGDRGHGYFVPAPESKNLAGRLDCQGLPVTCADPAACQVCDSKIFQRRVDKTWFDRVQPMRSLTILRMTRTASLSCGLLQVLCLGRSSFR